MPDIPTQVAANRDSTRRLDGQFIQLPETARINLSFARNEISVTPSLELYTRPLNNSLISGHPDGATHGSANGVSGDQRGTWSATSITVSSKKWTRDGRTAIRDALAGEAAGGIREIAVGTGTSAASVTDTALGTETGRTVAYGVKDASNEVRARANFGFSEDGLGGSDATEVGLFSDGGDLMARLVVDPVSIAESVELRVDITLTITGTGTGDSVVTNDGEKAIADALRSPAETIGLNEMAFGTNGTTPAKSDTALGNEVLRKNVTRAKGPERVEASTRVYESEPSSQPVTLKEIGVYDNQNPANLIWRVTFDPRDKDDTYGFDASVSFRGA